MLSETKVVLFCLLCSLSHSWAELIEEEADTQEIIQQILSNFSSTNVKTPPRPYPSVPVTVKVNFFVRSIEAIDEMRMEFRLQLTLRQQWEDKRIAFSHLSQDKIFSTDDLTSKIWTPDLFFSNEKQANFHNIMKPNVLMILQPNGSVLLSTRVSITLSCNMNLRYFPMDTQICFVIIASYAWPVEYLVLKWKDVNPVEVYQGLSLNNFKLKRFGTNSSRSGTTVGMFSFLQCSFLLEREFSYYLIALYIPCGMIVVISWTSFWLGENSLDARVSLGITTILTMVTQTYGINQSTAPPVSYIKALDVWTGTCLIFIGLTLLELCVVSICTRRKQLIRHRTSDLCSRSLAFSRISETKSQVDEVSRILFPSAFILFNFSYWSAYLFFDQSIRPWPV